MKLTFKPTAFLIILLFSFNCAVAEVEKVTISWTALLCNQRCIQQLDRHFSRIKGVAGVEFNQQAGMVELRWKPNVPFYVAPINIAMGLVGVSIKDIRVKVRGTIRASSKNYRIVSLGDNTSFTLLSPITPYRGTFATPFNPANRELSPEMRQKLYEAQKSNKIALIEGPLFMPERSPPLMIVLDQISFVEKSEAENKLERR